MNYQRLRDQLADAYLAAIPLTTLNILWFVASLPIVTLIPSTAALIYATNRLAHGKSADWRTFVEGFKLYFWRSWLWGLVNIAAVAIIISNYIFYGQVVGDWTRLARAAVIVLAFLWLTVQMYTLPLLMEQEKPRLRTALRNSLVALLRRPFASMLNALLIAALGVASTLYLQPAWVFITAAFCAYLANRATLGAIASITGRIEPEQTPEATPFS